MKLLRNILIGTLAVLVISWLGLQLFYHSLALDTPEVPVLTLDANSVSVENGTRKLGNSWYRQNQFGLWEAYIEGEAYERGRTFGLLAEAQIVSQEESFVAQIRKLIPSEWFLKTLKYGVVFFNRNLDEHVSQELKQEIYGVSQSFADDYDFIGDKYSRILNYHAAHDIGHALQDLSIVGCTSFAVWNQYSTDSSLVVGRNFDFYMGDDFAKDKVVLFMKPDSGYAFASITWAGFMGVVSGMNEHGLTVTLNAAKSAIPSGAKTPIPILAREILQYARTIDEAYVIAKSRKTFVSESLLIASADDKAAAIIEKSPDRIDIYRPNDARLTCSNHYQSETFKNDSINIKNIRDSDSEYRFKRLNQLLEANFPINPTESVEILRNQKGLNDADLGMGNPKAINQLLAHHGIVFQPEKRLLWISTRPFQLGEFVCYDLDEVFGKKRERGKGGKEKGKMLVDSVRPSSLGSRPFLIDSLSIPADTFLSSNSYKDFLRYKKLKNRLFDNIALGKAIEWNASLETEFVKSNPESYITYFMLGDYYLERDNFEKAKGYYELSLSKEVASEQERKNIRKNLVRCDE
ncbi:MAG: C45 family peptidase [Flavobacteriales bacterium]|nr:C45 family peptidase [Flavobacteriales bacterium]